MSPQRRERQPTRHDVEAFLNQTYPGADAATRLHALVCWVYHAPLFEGGGGRDAIADAQADVENRAADRGVHATKLRQIVAGDLCCVTWSALEIVLIACCAKRADIEVAQELYNTVSRTRSANLAGPRPLSFPDGPPGDQPSPSAGRVQDRDGRTRAPSPEEPADAERSVVSVGVPLSERPVAPAGGLPSAAVTVPDPMTATTVAEFVGLMKDFRTVKGETSLREMTKICERHPQIERPYTPGSFSAIGQNGKLPKRALVRAYIAGCGGNECDIERWDQAHAKLSLALSHQDITEH